MVAVLSAPRSTGEDIGGGHWALLRSSDNPIVQPSPHGAVFVFDHDLWFLSACGQSLDGVGLSLEMLEGKTIHDAFPAETAALIEPLYRAALVGQEPTFDVPCAERTFTQRFAP